MIGRDVSRETLARAIASLAAVRRDRAALGRLGIKISSTTIYRVRDELDGTTYNTNELEDAIREGHTMAARRGPCRPASSK